MCKIKLGFNESQGQEVDCYWGKVKLEYEKFGWNSRMFSEVPVDIELCANYLISSDKENNIIGMGILVEEPSEFFATTMIGIKEQSHTPFDGSHTNVA